MRTRNSKQQPSSTIRFFPHPQGHRAVFIVECRSPKDDRQLVDIVDMISTMATVVTISQGPITSFAVLTENDPSLFGKVEWLLKTHFRFSLVDRNLSDSVMRLVRDLCEQSGARMSELPECGVCGCVDPFPMRAILADEQRPQSPLLTYCSRCASPIAGEDPRPAVRALLRKDRRSFKIAADATVTRMRRLDAPDSRPERFAATG